jgi:saccharopine dehydrogenase (NAD+, L-lysine-forming)
MNRIYIRSEEGNEFRVALIPSDVKILIQKGFQVYVQTSENRIYKDIEYSKVGAILTTEKWHHDTYKDFLIVGLKEFDVSYLNNHTHIYFSHSFKGQTNSLAILNAFKDSNSKLYDFEYFVNNNKRVIAFGIYAGQVGCALGLLQASKLNNRTLGKLKPWSSYEEMLSLLPRNHLRIAIIGANGRCGQGVKKVLNDLSIGFDEFYNASDYTSLTEYDIIFNCILLDANYTKIWFDKNTVFTKSLIIVDISCDYSKPNNPIQLYEEATTWDKPVFHYNENVDIIAIDNLPSLLPRESSDDFSHTFRELLLEYPSSIWSNALEVFNKTSKSS